MPAIASNPPPIGRRPPPCPAAPAARPADARWLALSLTLASLAGCRYTAIRDQCPSCTVVSRQQPRSPLPPGTRRLFVLVPGLLGFGWEWDQPLVHLRAVPAAAIEAFDWRPGSSAARVGRDLAEVVDAALREAPSLEQVVLVGHSAGGLLTARAAALVHVPAGKQVLVVNVGTPYAGLHATPLEGPVDGWWSPLTLSIGGVFTAASYLPLAPRVTVESWVTPWPGDPVMKPRFGHHPDDPRVGPPGPRFPAPAGTDHNHVLGAVVEQLAARLRTAAAASAQSIATP